MTLKDPTSPPKTAEQERLDKATDAAIFGSDYRTDEQEAKREGNKSAEEAAARMIAREDKKYYENLDKDKSQAIREPLIIHPDGSTTIGGTAGEGDIKVPR